MDVTHLISPFRLYNLRRNPFGELSRQERAELAVVDVAEWVKHLQDERAVLQLIGPCGRGKTTHALAILHALPGAQYIYLPEDKPRPKVDDHRPMIVDESQRLTFFQLRRVLQVPGPLVLSTHADHARALRRAKRNVLSLAIGDEMTSGKLRKILNRRIEASRLGDGTIPQISDARAVQLHTQFGSDVRAIEHCLYEEFQQNALKQNPWPPAK